MASLDNFHTVNPAPQAPPSAGYVGRRIDHLYPYHLSERHFAIRKGLHAGTGVAEHWDVPNHLPIGPLQPMVDPLLATGRTTPDAQYLEMASSGLTSYFWPSRPRTRILDSGDTADYKLLVKQRAGIGCRLRNFLNGGGGQKNMVALDQHTRYHPYRLIRSS